MRAGLLGVALASLVGWASLGDGLPLTLVGETAFTLAQGQWLIGPVRLPTEISFLNSIEVGYGLTDSLEVGTRPLLFLVGFLNGALKYRVGRIWGWVTSLGAEMGLPFSLNYLKLGLGAELSLPGVWGWHAGIWVPLLPAVGLSAHLALDLSPLPWLHLLGEGTFGPTRLVGGFLARLWDLGLVRAVAGVELVEGGFSLVSYLEAFALFGPK